MGAFIRLQFLVALDRVRQLVVRDRGRAHLHHHDAAGVVRQLGRLGERGAGREGERERGDDGVAGAGDVRDLIGAGDRDQQRLRSLALEQRHAAAAARDQHRLAVESLLQRPRDVADLLLFAVPERRSGGGRGFLFVRRRGGDAGIAEQVVARVERDRLARARTASASRRRCGRTTP